MNKLYIIAILILCVQCKQETVAQSTKESITEEEVSKILYSLASDALEGRDTGSKGLEKAGQFIEQKLKTYDISPYFKTYKDTFKVNAIPTFNIVGYLKGTDPKLAHEHIIIGAHIDHIGTAQAVGGDTIANGANDNAAGSTAVLALAKYFATTKLNKRSILFVWFGAEEKGLLGSKHLAKKLKEKELDLYIMINFEMIGVPLKNKPYQAYITGYKTSNMATKLNAYAAQKWIGFLPKSKEYQLFKRSDNYPFYEQFHVPCQTISTFDFTNYDYYHHVDDEVEALDIPFMTIFINKCILPIEKMLNTSHQEIKLTP